MGEEVKEKEKFILLTVVLCLLMFFSFAQTVNDLRPTVTMKEYVDMQSELNRDWMKEVIDIQIENIKDNVNKANLVMDKRLDGMNEFRDALKDSNATYVTWQTLIGLIIGVSGFLFGYSNWKRNQQNGNNSPGKSIVSGDKVEVKK